MLFKYRVVVVNELDDHIVCCNVDTVDSSKRNVIDNINSICTPIYVRVCLRKIDTIKMWINNIILSYEQLYKNNCTT